MIDLHAHTTASDGEHSPTKLVDLAGAAGVTRLAVTDHDTLGGLARAGARATEIGLDLVPGIEISASLDGREVHVLGHFVIAGHDELASFCANVLTARARRMEAMIARLQDLGVPVTLDEVLEIAQGAHLCRPHLARAVVARGVCESVHEVFARFLGDGRPAHVQRERIDATAAIALVHRAGGTATVAHPGPSGIDRAKVAELARAGLDGIEVFHAEHAEHERARWLSIARESGLVPTAGSDFHGERTTPGRVLGTPMEEAAFEALRARARSGRTA